MPRRRVAAKREITPDPLYKSNLLARFINCLMVDGKKSTAEKIAYGALEIIREKTKKEPLEVFEQAIKNLTPLVEVKARRVGGATYQVPMEVKAGRGTTLALRWLIHFARTRGGRTMSGRLANEIMDAANETGAAIKKREETHRMAEANKAFAHYRY